MNETFIIAGHLKRRMLAVDFGQSVNISNSLLHSALPQVAVVNEKHVYIVWHESSGIYGQQASDPNIERKRSASIFYRASHDNGLTFDRVNELYAFQSALGFPPAVAVSKKRGKVILAWGDLIDRKNEHPFGVFIASTKGEDGGTGQFEIPRRLDANGYASGSTPFKMTRQPTGTKNRGSTKTGLSMSNRDFRASPTPRVALSGDNVYVLWLGVKDLLANQGQLGPEHDLHRIHLECDLLLKTSHDGGDNFDHAISLANFRVRGTEQGAGNLTLKVRNKNIYVLWHQVGSGQASNSTLLRKSANGGKSFGPPIALNHTYSSVGGDRAQSPLEHSAVVYLSNIAVDEDENSAEANTKDELYAAWTIQEPRSTSGFDFGSSPFRGNNSMYFAKMVGSGETDTNNITFPAYTRIATNTAGVGDVLLGVSGQNVYAFWNDIGTGEIRLRSSCDGGISFGPPFGIKGTDANKRNTTSFPTGPVVLCRGNRIFVAWHSYLAQGYSTPLDSGSSTSASQRQFHMPRTAIQFSASADKGATFSVPRSISNDNSYRAGNANLALSKDYLYIACAEGAEWNPDIFFRVGRIKS